MTFAEISRVIESKKRVMEIEEKKKALFYYKLADLIGFSVARVHNSKNKMPTIYEAFPTYFQETEEEKQQKTDEVSAIRFRQFAQAFNINFKKGVSKHNE